MRPFSVNRQHVVSIHELTMNGVGGFMSENAKVVVRARKAYAVENTVGADETLRESSTLATLAWHDIHPAIRRVEQGCQLASILPPERR